MYLVLIAMLALNVQREILDACVTLNSSIEDNNTNVLGRLQSLYGEFKFAYSVDAEKTRPYYEKAELIRDYTAETITWMDSLKAELMITTEGVEGAEADSLILENVRKLDAYDDCTRILIGVKKDGSTGKARQMKDLLNESVTAINNHLRQAQLQELDNPFDFSEKETEAGILPWEMHVFYDKPIATVIPVINTLQSEMRNLEYNAVSSLFGQIDVDDIPVDTVMAKVVPNSNYILLGENYDAEIFLGAYSTTSAPEIEIGNGQAIEVTDGIGQYTLRPTAEGVHTYKGSIKVKDKRGGVREYPFESEYTVARPSAVVSPTAMNVLYVGPENPLAISVPGIPDDRVVPSITGGNTLRKTGDGQYIASMSKSSPRDVKVNVQARMDDGSMKNMGVIDFRVKRLPRPYVRFRDIESSGKLNKADICNGYFTAEYDKNFVFDLPLTVESWTLIVSRNGGQISEKNGRGRMFNPAFCDLINSMRPGDFAYFEDVVVKDVNGDLLPTNNIKVEVKR